MEERILRDILVHYRGNRGELVPILQEVQESLGYLPEKAMLDPVDMVSIP